MIDRSLLLLLVLAACAGSQPPATPPPDATAAPEPPPVIETPTETPPQEPTPVGEPAEGGGPPPPPPPQPLASTDAFYIIGLPGTAKKPAARVCDSVDTCKPLVGENSELLWDFSDESWVVISTPGAHDVAVVSDGKTASVTLTPRCPGSEDTLGKDPRIVLWRVARSVKAAKVSTAPKCAKAP